MTTTIGFGRYGPAEGVVTGSYTGGGADPGTPIFYGDLIIETLQASSVMVQSPEGGQTADVHLEWDAPSVGEDPTLLNMVGSYLISYRTGNDSWSPELTSIDRDVMLTGFPVGKPILVRVRAKTNAGAYGPWHEYALITAYDTAPPPQPTEPHLTASIRGVQAAWDGEFVVPGVRPDDFLYVRAEFSKTAGFEEVVNGGTLASAGSTAATLAFGTGSFRVYARFVAVDRAGNQSQRSTVTYIDSARIINSDLDDGAIDSRLLAVGAIQSTNVADFALTVRKFTSLSHQLY